MMKLTGQLLNVYKTQDFTDKETGKVSKGKNKVQLLVSIPMRNNQTKKELLDISIPEERVGEYRGKEGKDVEVSVAYIGKPTFYGI